ncbi:MAG: hypothetical protein RL213_1001 [Bacteroidota bacterium]|jgi:hypothetical protein
MLKDIHRPEVENLALAVVMEKDEETGETVWNVYLLNLYEQELTGVLVASKGYGELNGEPVKTSVLRHLFEHVAPLDFVKIEPIMPQLFGLSNEYWVSFYLDRQIYDKKYVFLPESITQQNFTAIPFINKPGVMIR